MLGLINRLRRSREAASDSKVEKRSLGESLLEIFGITPTISGACVTPSTAMRCTAVRAAVQALSEAIGMIPLHVFRRGPDGSKERAPDHPVQSVLHGSANDFTPSSEFLEAMTRDALLFDAGGLAYVNRVNGKVIELLRFTPGAVSVEIDPEDGSPIYRRNGPGGGIIARQNVLHLRPPGLHCPTSDAKEAIALALTLEAHGARLFGPNAARPQGVLTFPHKLGSDTAVRIRESWTAAHAGANSGRTAVLEEGGSFVPLTFNSVDSQYIELRQFCIAEIARTYRVAPIFLMDFGRATWSNSEQMARQFVDFALMPWLLRWTGEIQLKLFDRTERATYFAEFQTDAFVRADISARMDAYSKAIAARILSPNEARQLENRAPYPDGDKFENPNTATAKSSAANAE